MWRKYFTFSLIVIQIHQIVSSLGRSLQTEQRDFLMEIKCFPLFVPTMQFFQCADVCSIFLNEWCFHEYLKAICKTYKLKDRGQYWHGVLLQLKELITCPLILEFKSTFLYSQPCYQHMLVYILCTRDWLRNDPF